MLEQLSLVLSRKIVNQAGDSYEKPPVISELGQGVPDCESIKLVLLPVWVEWTCRSSEALPLLIRHVEHLTRHAAAHGVLKLLKWILHEDHVLNLKIVVRLILFLFFDWRPSGGWLLSQIVNGFLGLDHELALL